jgi:thymidylate kinase
MNGDLARRASEYEVVVLEGCDGVGKTTLAAVLGTHHSYAVVHSSRTPDGVDLGERYRAILARPGRLLLDRSFVSELVYGPLRHGRSRLNFADAATLAVIVAARGGVLIHLTGQPERIAARLLTRDGKAPGLEAIRALIDSYTSVFARLAEHALVITVDATEAAS